MALQFDGKEVSPESMNSELDCFDHEIKSQFFQVRPCEFER